MCPGRNKKRWKRNLEQDLNAIHNDYMADVLVSLVREEELIQMGLHGRFFETITAAPYQMISRHFPIKDKWLPRSSEELIDLALWIAAHLEQGRKVVVHCNGGKGRAATVCCAVLMALGQSYQYSKSIIQETRPGTLVNPFQQVYLRYMIKKKLQNTSQPK